MTTMTDNEMRVAIAKADGFRMVASDFTENSWVRPDGTFAGIGLSSLPDYLNDLNAIQAAVLRLSYEEQRIFCRSLEDLVYRVVKAEGEFDETGMIETPYCFQWRVLTATPLQWCEALVAVKGNQCSP